MKIKCNLDTKSCFLEVIVLKKYKVLVIADAVLAAVVLAVLAYYASTEGIELRFWVTLAIFAYAISLLVKNWNKYKVEKQKAEAGEQE